jgi:hypothetical protein
MIFRICAGLALAMLSLAAVAADDLAVQLAVYRIDRAPDGREVLTPTDQVHPGTELEYQARYRNRGKTTVNSVQAVLPIPAGSVVLLLSSPHPAQPLASADGRRFERMPLLHWVTLPDGKREQRPLAPAQYRTLRWALGDIPPGTEKTVSARVRVADRAGTTVLAQGEQQ